MVTAEGVCKTSFVALSRPCWDLGWLGVSGKRREGLHTRSNRLFWSSMVVLQKTIIINHQLAYGLKDSPCAG